MFKFFLTFWPILLPILLYCLWFLSFRKKKDNETHELSEKEAKLWILALYSSLAIAILAVIFMALVVESDTESRYVPSQYKDGEFIPAKKVKPDEQADEQQ